MTLFYWPLNNALFCCAGSKSVKNIRKRQQAKKTDIYTRMKNSVCPPSTSTDNLAVEEYTVGDTVQKCQNNIQRVITVINKTKKKLIEYHCMFGRELMQYKLISFSKHCEKCTVDKVAALSCRRCVKMACNLTRLDEFMGKGKQKGKEKGKGKENGKGERERKMGKGKHNIWQVTLHTMLYESIMRLKGKEKGKEKGKGKGEGKEKRKTRGEWKAKRKRDKR